MSEDKENKNKETVVSEQCKGEVNNYCKAITKALSSFRGRIAGASSEKACARYLRDELNNVAPTRLEPFKFSPIAGRTASALIGAVFFLALVVYYVSFAGNRLAGVLVALLALVIFLGGGAVVGAIFLGSKRLCKYLPGKVSYNVFSESKLAKEEEEENQLVIASSHSSAPGSYFTNFDRIRKIVFICLPISIVGFLLFVILKMALGVDSAAKSVVFAISPPIFATLGIVPLALHFSFLPNHARENNGVATATALAVYKHLLENKQLLPENTRVCFISFGGEYVAHAGSRAFAASHPEIKGARAIVIEDITSDKLRLIQKDALRGVELAQDMVSAVEIASGRCGVECGIKKGEGIKDKLSSLHGYMSEALASQGCDSATLTTKDYITPGAICMPAADLATKIFEFAVNLAAATKGEKE